MDAAYALGIRYFDAARSYGRAEEFLASWLASRPGSLHVEVASKWGYTYSAGWTVDADKHEVKDHSLAAFDRQREETRATLGARLAIYQIHSATADSGVLSRSDVLDALARLRDDGIAIGLSTSGPAQAVTITRAIEITRAGAPLFSVVQSTFNVLERSAKSALVEAHASGRRVVIKEAMANGRLAARGDHARVGDVRALAWVLAQPFVDVVLSGASTVAQLESNARARDYVLSGEDLQALDGLEEEPTAYWGKRATLAWN